MTGLVGFCLFVSFFVKGKVMIINDEMRQGVCGRVSLAELTFLEPTRKQNIP